MIKILFLPFLQMQTGHHNVADALIRSLESRLPDASLQKVDILSFGYERFEKVVRNVYLQWINHWPQSYKHIYKHFVYPATYSSYLKWFEFLLQDKMFCLVSELQPDLIVCTQAYPSLILSRLKEQGKISTHIVNVYTDFFVNKVWGRKGIDFHFVPDRIIKEELVKTYTIPESRVIVTGIPIDESFEPNRRATMCSLPYKILVTGGNGGLGDLSDLLKKAAGSEFDFLVLCGNNKRLFKEISSWRLQNIKPFPYIDSSAEVSRLYDQADALITKPGGVTISEALQKKLPIFVHSTLPGQEEVNLWHLTTQGLVYKLNLDQPIREQIRGVLDNKSELDSLNQRMLEFDQNFDATAWEKIMEILEFNPSFTN